MRRFNPKFAGRAFRDNDLDNNPDLVGAWGFSKLLTNYAGAIATGRRESDSSIADFYWNGSDLQTASGDARSVFAAGSSIRLTTLYDQTGGGNNWIQTTASAQPYLYYAAYPSFYFLDRTLSHFLSFADNGLIAELTGAGQAFAWFRFQVINAFRFTLLSTLLASAGRWCTGGGGASEMGCFRANISIYPDGTVTNGNFPDFQNYAVYSSAQTYKFYPDQEYKGGGDLPPSFDVGNASDWRMGWHSRTGAFLGGYLKHFAIFKAPQRIRELALIT